MSAASGSELEVELLRTDDRGLGVGFLGWGDDEKGFAEFLIKNDSRVWGGGEQSGGEVGGFGREDQATGNGVFVEALDE